MTKRLRVLGQIAVVCVVAFVTSAVAAQGSAAAARAMLAKYAGSYDADALMKEPKVRAELPQLLGGELKHLERNLNVKGAVDVIGSTLSISGNAPHQGAKEEAVVCVTPINMKVEAAILSKGAVTVFTRAERYDYTTLCIKDWITLAKSRHVDRMKQPKNVRVVRPR